MTDKSIPAITQLGSLQGHIAALTADYSATFSNRLLDVATRPTEEGAVPAARPTLAEILRDTNLGKDWSNFLFATVATNVAGGPVDNETRFAYLSAELYHFLNQYTPGMLFLNHT